MKKSKLLEKFLYCVLIVGVAAVMYVLKIGCPFKTIFKIPCPGCGITRAYLSVLHLDFAKAFEYNPMFWSVPILFLLMLFDDKFKHKWVSTALYIAIFAGFVAQWIYQLAA